MKLRKNIFDNYFFLNFSNLLKNFFLPPFFFNLIKKLFKKKRPKKYFQFWKGEELKIDYSIQNDSIKNIDRILTRNSLSREAGKFQNNQIIKFKNITNYEKIQFGVNAEKFIQDLSFFSNKIV